MFNQCKLGIDNIDSEYGKRVIEETDCKFKTYAIDVDADIRAQNLLNTSKFVTFDVNGQEQYFLSFVSNENNPDAIRMFINPRVMYSGSDYTKVEVLGLFTKRNSKKALVISAPKDSESQCLKKPPN